MMKRLLMVSLGGLALLFCQAAPLLCATSQAQGRFGPQPAIRIGVGAPMTGSDAVFGTQVRNGVERAIQDINTAGGIDGHRLVMEAGDDAGDPKQAIAVAKRFAADHVDFVIGHFNSGVTLAAAPIYADHNILAITPASTNPQITERGFPMMFRTCGNDRQQPAVAAKFLASLGPKKIAIVHDKSTYGKELADATRDSLANLGIREVLYDGVNKDERNYAALVNKLKAAQADFLYFGGTAGDAARIIRQAREHGVATVMIASAAIAADEFGAIGGDAAAGTLMTFPLDPRTWPEAAKVVQEFRARNIEPETYTLYAYAAVEIIKQAAEKAHSLAPQEVAKAMHSGMRFATVLGALSYDAHGDLTRPDYGIFVWKKDASGRIDFEPLKH